MPILQREQDVFPSNLFDSVVLGKEPDRCWWALYSLSRREKDLMRRLTTKEIPFYGPVIEKRRKIGGRQSRSFLPLFPSYVFIYGDSAQRYEAMTTNCVSRCLHVSDGERLTSDLRQFHYLIQTGTPLTPESRLEVGRRVQVKRGRLAGIEGTILRREGQLRLLVAVDFLQQGASLLIDDLDVEMIY